MWRRWALSAALRLAMLTLLGFNLPGRDTRSCLSRDDPMSEAKRKRMVMRMLEHSSSAVVREVASPALDVRLCRDKNGFHRVK